MDLNPLDELNNKLDDLGIPATSRFATDTVGSIGLSQPGYRLTCHLLYSALRHHDKTLASLSEDATAAEYYSALSPRGVWFGVEDSDYFFSLISYLVVNLQAERLLAWRTAPVAVTAIAGNVLKFQLGNVCRALHFNSSGKRDTVVIEELIGHIASKSCEHTKDCVNSYPRLLPKLDLLDEEKAFLLKVSDAFWQDFALRRRMLLKRLDVTLASFLQGKQVSGREQEFREVLSERRALLSELPPKFTLQDALLAPMSLIYLQSKFVSNTPTVSASHWKQGLSGHLVKTILIGSVPDRGGRVTQLKPKSFDVFGEHWSAGRGSGHNNNGRGNLHNKNNTRGQHYEVTSSEAMANSNHKNKKKSGKTGEKQPPSANAHRVDAPSTEQSASGKVAMY